MPAPCWGSSRGSFPTCPATSTCRCPPSTLLRHLAAGLAGESERRWVPVFESLPRLMREPEFLLTRLERQLLRTGERVKGLAGALEREAQEGRLLLLLDGLDEVPRERREEAESALRDFSTRLG